MSFHPGLSRCILHDPTFSQSLIASTSEPITHQRQEPGPSDSSTPPCPPPPPPCPSFPPLLSGRLARQREQCDTVDREGTAGCPGNRLQTQRHTDHAPADVTEDILLNTLQNLMTEAVRGELVLTAHPRTIILPPISRR